MPPIVSPITQPRSASSRPIWSVPYPPPMSAPTRRPDGVVCHHSPSTPDRRMSSHIQLLSTELEMEYSGDHAGPTFSSENGTCMIPLCSPQPATPSPHSLRRIASVSQG